MVKSSQIKQKPYRSSGFVFQGDKRAGFISKPVKDCGSENDDIAAVHCFLTGSNLSYRYDTSLVYRTLVAV